MIEVLVVNHCTAAETVSLVAALPAEGFAARVLDNASGSNDLDLLRSCGAAVDASERNLGFGAGVNRLAGACSAEWLLLMNPDVEPEAGVLEGLSARLPSDPRVAVVGGLRTGAGPRSFGRFPGLLDRVRAAERVPAEGPVAVDWVSGCFMLIRRAAFAQVGGFDEGYFMQLEDIDLCWRFRRQGWATMLDPTLRFRHRGHLSYARSGRSVAFDYRASKLRFLEQSGRPLAALVLRLGYRVLGLNPNGSS